ncbi:hypothetical protein ABBQ32_000856 [Trebouxia sp. C0010 RCD-2024]
MGTQYQPLQGNRKYSLQCPFCLKPFKNYHSLQRHTNRLSKTAADEGQHQWKLPRVGDITVLSNEEHATARDRSPRGQFVCINSIWLRLSSFA